MAQGLGTSQSICGIKSRTQCPKAKYPCSCLFLNQAMMKFMIVFLMQPYQNGTFVNSSKNMAEALENYENANSFTPNILEARYERNVEWLG